MSKLEIIERLHNFGYTTEDYGLTVQVTEPTRIKVNELSINEVHAALDYRVERHSIKQVDPWTIVVIVEE